MEAFGAPAELIDEARQEQEAEDAFEVHADNAEIVWAFLSLQTQWRIVGGFGAVIYQGFDYGSIPAALSMLGIHARRRGEVFDGLRVMEAAALPWLNQGDGPDPVIDD